MGCVARDEERALPQDVQRSVQLTVNGEPRSTAAETLASLLAELGYGSTKVATALNGDFVPERERSRTSLNAGDTVEILAPRQGG